MEYLKSASKARVSYSSRSIADQQIYNKPSEEAMVGDITNMIG
jgi:hypothetical protein